MMPHPVPEREHAYAVRLEGFEGPLDLLLHLIQKNKLNIADIPVALITEQYLDYLKLMKELNLDIAGEYLLMAATLLHIKSRILLPGSSEDKGEEEDVDPRADLVQRLLEYQKYKGAARELEQRPWLYRDVFIRGTEIGRNEPEGERIETSLFQLLEAFRQVLARAQEEAVHEVKRETLTVEQKIEEILAFLRHNPRSVAFHTLFPEGASRGVIVIIFLAILELVKEKAIRVFQAAPFETIRIAPV